MAGVSDAQAIENVFKSWNTNRDLGTKMHKAFEQFLNDEPVAQAADLPVEMEQFRDALQQLSDLAPVRTELTLYANDAAGDAAVAGQIDLLMRDAEARAAEPSPALLHAPVRTSAPERSALHVLRARAACTSSTGSARRAT